LLFAALAFVFLMKANLYPAEIRSTNLDTDWVYRRFLPRLIAHVGKLIQLIDSLFRFACLLMIKRFLNWLSKSCSARGWLGSTWSTSSMAFWAAALLGVFLILYYL
jgi:multicomponent Na+:H+ antiporter subunit D